ncbi:hypothetical protein [Streptomyces sp. NPDC046751]|uniref:hypothetical protein n=1 Tax=Streptomyces sp. NPDC046751 TaxID=3160977 RepID=UPI0033D5BBBE
MTTTPAAELHAAAETLRALATAASTDTDGTPTTTWSTEPCWPNDDDGTSRLYGDYRTRDDGHRIAWPPLLHGGSSQRPTRMHTQHATYAAAMGPAVGLALADWLDSWTGVEISEHGPMFEDARHALAVARQILGTTTEQPEAEDESYGRFVPDTPRAPGLCASCGDARGWHSRLAVEAAAEAQQPTKEG